MENNNDNSKPDHRVENAYDDTKSTTKKVYRKLKRVTRDALGNESIVRDLKDKIDDTTDRIKNS